MEPEVLIVEVDGQGAYKVFFTGVSLRVCSGEEVLRELEGKLHLFILLPSNINKKQAYDIAEYFFSNSKIESISTMYASVASSFALGVQSISVLTVHPCSEGIVASIDLVCRSTLLFTYSSTETYQYNEYIDEVLKRINSPKYKSTTAKLHVRGEPSLMEKVQRSLQERGAFSVDQESAMDVVEIDSGYTAHEFPAYFSRMMPHNMVPGSDVSYVGAVLTIMINYFEIKEVNTREDFESGLYKHLLLN
ncbi:hypothetical protein NEFER03_0096 [Nematocida sp. LUAm3]|nr:hypothetical protein NEFER03_0096 [Nematocida sp. LUAm3]KAI5173549.1 hypothetical protein NEFER02_0065 [Nematocida sp. LUAm2]KAI5176770.1 hypothetical protein NEFER01_0095 [Nematocida sp. LUAm1]